MSCSRLKEIYVVCSLSSDASPRQLTARCLPDGSAWHERTSKGPPTTAPVPVGVNVSAAREKVRFAVCSAEDAKCP